MKSQKNGHGNTQIAKIFLDLYMGIPKNATNLKNRQALVDNFLRLSTLLL